MVTREVIWQVVWIRSLEGSGSAFTVIFDRRQYLVTARHVLDGDRSDSLPKEIDIDIRYTDKWEPVTCSLVGVSPDPFDVAVLALPRPLPNALLLGLGTPAAIYSQEVYFLGFPHELHGRVGLSNDNFPLPYVKRAIVAMVHGAHQQLMVLDGRINVGFSGGPVVFKNPLAEGPRWTIAGVVVGAFTSVEPVLNGLEKTTFSVESDTGLISVCPIDVVVELIRLNPVGPFMPLPNDASFADRPF